MQDDLDRVLSKIRDAIALGNANALASQSSAYVEVSLFGAGRLYSRSQATYILKDFFKEYPPGAFSFKRKLHVGDDWYLYGNYMNYSGNAFYRMEIRIHKYRGRYEIKNIRIVATER